MFTLVKVQNRFLLVCDQCGALNYRYKKTTTPVEGSLIVNTDLEPVWPEMGAPTPEELASSDLLERFTKCFFCGVGVSDATYIPIKLDHYERSSFQYGAPDKHLRCSITDWESRIMGYGSNF